MLWTHSFVVEDEKGLNHLKELFLNEHTLDKFLIAPGNGFFVL